MTKKPGARPPARKKKKTTTRRSAPKRKPRPVDLWQRVLLGLTILFGVVVAAGFLADRFIGRPAAPPRPKPAQTRPAAPPPPVAKVPAAVKPAPSEKAPEVPEPSRQPPVFEVYPKTEAPPPPPPAPKPPLDDLPKVAIIIDDLGYDQGMARKFLRLDANLTASILPHSPFADEVCEMVRRQGGEAMLHLPMEPDEYPSVSPGSDALLKDMAPDALIAQLERNLDALPEAKGVNNHMGSRLTRESAQMRQVFSVLKRRGLYFVDSRTTPDTVGRSTARLFKVPFAERDVFIDHYLEKNFIRGQIKKLIKRAARHGQAVGIGHPHPSTYEVLKQMLPELKKKARLVPASQVVHDWS